MFQRILAHPNITVLLNAAYIDVMPRISFKHLIYTGPIDEFYEYRFGHLPYRSLRFEPETLKCDYYQPAVQVNYPNDYGFTRIVELKHITGQHLPVTTIVREYPQDYKAGREPYYPIPAPDARALYRQYDELAQRETDVTIVGRLATYRYYNMDQVVATALAESKRLLQRLR